MPESKLFKSNNPTPEQIEKVRDTLRKVDAKRITQFCIFLSFIWLFVYFYTSLWQHFFGVWPFLIGASLAWVFLEYTTIDLDLAMHIFLGGSLLSIVRNTFLLGGLRGPLPGALVLLLLACGVLKSRTSVFFWVFVTKGYLLILYFLTEHNLLPNPTIPIEYLPTLNCGVIMSTLATTSVCVLNMLDLEERSFRWSLKYFGEKISSEYKGKFISHMNHEIRTPLTGVIGWSELLKSKIGEEGEITDVIDSITTCSKTLLKITSVIIDFQQIDSENMIIQSVPFNINEFFRNMVTMYKAPNRIGDGDKDIRFLHSINEISRSYVYGDEFRLIQCVNSLLSNAFKFTSEGEITFQCCQERPQRGKDGKEWVKTYFRVKDSGIGIDENLKRNLFVPFEQGNSSRTKKFGGIGLGLSITKLLIDKMGGSIFVSSEKGKGSLFTIELEFECCDKSAIQDVKKKIFLKKSKSLLRGESDVESPRDENRLDFRGLKVLVVEDNKMNQKLINSILSKLGCSISSAFNGLEGLDIVKKDLQGFHLIFMDLHMAVLDGISATKRIRQLEKDNHIKNPVPIIGITADVDIQTILEMKSSGFDDVIEKPFKINQIHSYMRKYALDF